MFDRSQHIAWGSAHARWSQTVPITVRGPKEYDYTALPTLGWMTITDVGEENIYFTLADGTKGFCKVLA